MSDNRDRFADVARLERLAADAWPAQERSALGDWLMRIDPCPASKRVNSVLAAGPYPANDWLERAIAFYANRGRPCRFQISAASPADLDLQLAEAGFLQETPCLVWTAPIPLPESAGDDSDDKICIDRITVDVVPEPLQQWLNDWSRLEDHAADLREAYAAIVRRIPPPAAYAIARSTDGTTIGVASAVAQGGWLGLFNLVVSSQHRRRGTGAMLIRSLADWGARAGCRAAYLQVLADNEPAQRLYRKLGFRPAYAYHYRELRF
ncbi:MAG: hypothetical protein BLM47_00355 [Candidatus Reconcilbacillus cellulovorans]|uniref:N-acetyltransferase domain-containing protein n=1 Tax=Candidatus Reconcilbacillus cellulovorans TaxID=1906605 RepID=A0A2A6E465_9BACL|nr:MAG: hypothetical protein BLM47_00355 [Candidatus Reconcilbacillus cellulovorans]